MDRYLVKVYFNRPGEPKAELTSLSVHIDPDKGEGSYTAYNKALSRVIAQITAEVVGKMGPDADDGFQDGVVR